MLPLELAVSIQVPKCGFLLVLVRTGMLFRIPEIHFPARFPKLRSSCLGIETIHFLRAMEEEILPSPFFGILALKRLSWLSASTLSRSRETFNAQHGSLVKRQVF
jgi:hypothetical protein